MRLLLSLFVLVSTCILSTYETHAQHRGVISGIVKEAKTQQVVESAAVSIMNTQDSTVRGTFSDKDGLYTIKNLPLGNYKLYCNFFGYKTMSRSFSITKEKLEHKQDLLLDSAIISLNEITVVAEAPPVVLKKDTVEYNASSFKTKDYAPVEELIKQLPGVDVGKDGSITTQGQKVTAVLVDGKPFFIRDPKIATQSLPANIINKVQVITVDPEKSENGQSGLIINLTVKKDKKKGTFGNLSAGAGSNNQYKGNLSLHRFNNEQQFSLLSTANNVSSEGGISNTYSVGLNINTPLSSKTSLSLGYLYNSMDNNRSSQLYRSTLLSSGSLFYSDRSTNNSSNQNHSINLNFEYQINTFSKINIAPSISFRKSNSLSSSLFESSNTEGKINDGNRSINSGMKTPDFSNNINYSTRFKNKRRRLNLNIRNSYNSNEQTGLNYSLSNYYSSGSLKQTLINQKNADNSSSTNHSINMLYTEPISQNHSLKFAYDFNNSIENSSRNTYDYNELNNEFDLTNGLMSNEYRNRTNYNRVGISFNSTRNSLNNPMEYSAGVSIQKTDLKGKSLTKDSTYTQNRISIFPQASLNYKISKNESIGSDYRGDIRQPSISELQPTPDNSNPLYIRMGNPNLQPEFNNMLSINYRNFDPTSNQSLFANLSFSTIFNKITYNSLLDINTGKQLSKPENVSGNYNFNFNVNMGVPIKNLKTKPGINAQLNRNTTYINGSKTTTLKSGFGILYNINYRYKDYLDLNMNCNANYSNLQYDQPGLKDANYINFSSSVNVSYYLPMNFALNTDLTYSKNANQIQTAKKSVTLLNAGIYKEFLKGKQAKLSIDAYDLLKQNTSINRTITNNQIEDRQSNNLQQYFMLSFTYRLNKFKQSQ
ncbi:outer membrane beta-barrel protein [Solitalea lacus]|uniref:outer membrane beta-barrel protein n=1 Tax=Solitalea lacus TaxID=2911172 RepID=UPI001EDA6CAD|nr:outer membrane beta-barrel family protein [Solitalea lacus]UKJ08603.1 TonB-dependent receptor [Solitalea lacus]